MTALVTGAGGLLGRALLAALGDREVIAPTHRQLDVGDPAAVAHAVAAARPRAVFHLAAYTHVDACEREPERAWRDNADAAGHVADAAARCGARLVLVSTDYVFSGAAGRPYHEGDAPGPGTVYGASKLAGERIASVRHPDTAIARVSWLFGPGREAFVDRLVAWGRADGPPVRIAADQRGVPTSTTDAARALIALADASARGVFHVTSAGDASRYQLAQAVFAHIGAKRELEPATLAEFPSPARRPLDSRMTSTRLESLRIEMPCWRDALARHLDEVAP